MDEYADEDKVLTVMELTAEWEDPDKKLDKIFQIVKCSEKQTKKQHSGAIQCA